MRSGSQQRFISFVVAAAVVVLGGCSVLTKGDSSESTSPSATDAATATAPSIAVIDPVAEDNALVAGCVEWVQTGAFLGLAQMQVMWTQAGQDPNALTTQCTSMLTTQRLVLRQMSAELAELRGSTTTTLVDGSAVLPANHA